MHHPQRRAAARREVMGISPFQPCQRPRDCFFLVLVSWLMVGAAEQEEEPGRLIAGAAAELEEEKESWRWGLLLQSGKGMGWSEGFLGSRELPVAEGWVFAKGGEEMESLKER